MSQCFLICLKIPVFTLSYSETEAKHSRSPSRILISDYLCAIFNKYDFVISLYVFSIDLEVT